MAPRAIACGQSVSARRGGGRLYCPLKQRESSPLRERFPGYRIVTEISPPQICFRGRGVNIQAGSSGPDRAAEIALLAPLACFDGPQIATVGVHDGSSKTSTPSGRSPIDLDQPFRRVVQWAKTYPVLLRILADTSVLRGRSCVTIVFRTLCNEGSFSDGGEPFPRRLCASRRVSVYSLPGCCWVPAVPSPVLTPARTAVRVVVRRGPARVPPRPTQVPTRPAHRVKAPPTPSPA